MTIPICCVTGRIAGDADACGDCDPCGAAYTVPEAVKRLLAEKEEWRQKYGTAMAELDARPSNAMEPGEMSAGFARRARDPWR